MMKTISKRVLEYYISGNQNEDKRYKAGTYEVNGHIYLATQMSVVDITKYGVPNILCNFGEYSPIDTYIKENIGEHLPDTKKIRLRTKRDMYKYNSRNWGYFIVGNVTVTKIHMMAILSLLPKIFNGLPTIDLYVENGIIKIYVDNDFFATLMGV